MSQQNVSAGPSEKRPSRGEERKRLDPAFGQAIIASHFSSSVHLGVVSNTLYASCEDGNKADLAKLDLR
jgi:hypothetical protein